VSEPAPRRRWFGGGSEQSARHRRKGALLVLGIGFALVLTTLQPDWPKDQPLIFRLPATHSGAGRLQASFTRVGAARALQGFTIELDGSQRSVRHQPRLPDGDYLVTIELTSTHSSGRNPPAKMETTEVRRVTLGGQETTIVIEGEQSE
jgi:hypothetical protein